MIGLFHFVYRCWRALGLGVVVAALFIAVLVFGHSVDTQAFERAPAMACWTELKDGGGYPIESVCGDRTHAPPGAIDFRPYDKP